MPAATHRRAADTLDQDIATLRALQLQDVDYELEMQLDAGSPEYRGEVRIRFGFTLLGAPLTIDFGGGVLDAVFINGTPFNDLRYNGFFPTIPEVALRRGSNEVRIRYRHPWSKEGSGLFRIVDPLDSRAYVYSESESHEASRAFPCFDQPDLKARHTLAVEAPATWRIISAARESASPRVRESAIEDLGAKKHWKFPATTNFSSCLFSLHGGEYRVGESVARVLRDREDLGVSR
jgi:aminopeptidase N